MRKYLLNTRKLNKSKLQEKSQNIWPLYNVQTQIKLKKLIQRYICGNTLNKTNFLNKNLHQWLAFGGWKCDVYMKGTLCGFLRNWSI